MLEASDAGKFFNPIVKKVWPNCVNIPIPIIQIKSFRLGVTQFRNTIGNKVITETRGKYLIIIKISSVAESFLTVM